MRPLWKSVDLAALRHNVRVLAAQAGAAQVVAVVKADAYGHGVAALLPVLREMPSPAWRRHWHCARWG